jgi:DNA polymerase III subunit alpha
MSTVPEALTETPITPFVPLHVHSQFSLLEASSRVKDLVKQAKANNMPAMALTDSGNIYGAVEFYKACKSEGINPIIGVELAVIEGDITDKSTRTSTLQLVLLCKNYTGYQNLVKLISIGHLEGFYYRPRINWELLEQHREGLIVLTDCTHGPIGYHVLRGHRDEARKHLAWLKRVFGEDVYIELQDHHIGTEMQITQEAVALAKEMEMACVITNDSRFTYPGQETIVDILLCMQVGTTLHDENRRKRFNNHYYLKNGNEMLQLLNHLDKGVVKKAVANTLKVAEKIHLEWPMDESILPAFPLPEGQSELGYLKEISTGFAHKKYGDVLPDVVVERLAYELNVIGQMGFPAYFLIVWDFMNWAREQGVPVGPGRGSAAGSLVAYVLGITNIDPIEHSLLFERFLNPERVSMPDVDIDFCIERRGEVIDYVAKRYGAERVCQIATFGTLAARAAVKAVARVLDIPFEESNRISKMIPAMPGTKLKDALEDGMELANETKNNPHIKEWIDYALQLEGTACNVGTHAAGVVISKDPLDEVIALQQSKDGMMISQFTMGDLESLGLLKMDFLGLRNLTIIRNTMNLIEESGKPLPDIEAIHLDDEKTYQLLTAGDTDGVFQLESSGMKELVKNLKPSVFEDINALVALYRPGPLNSGMAKDFVERKHGRQEVSYPHESLKEILEPTYGTIVYQEQIMQIAQVLAGYSLGRADLLRRAMGKKKADVMEKEREGFVAGCVENNVDAALANGLFDTMSEFAAYCFNRSHSAAYAFIAYQTAYLKCHYPIEYLSALLSSVRDNLDKIQHYIITCRRMGIAILPPSVETSLLNFTPDKSGESIRFGLASIKGVGVGVVENIINTRKEQPFETLEDFLKRVNTKVLNRKTMEALIQAGALECFGYSRKHLMHNLESLFSYADTCAHQAETGQASLFDLLADTDDSMSGLMLQGDSNDEYSDDVIQKSEKDLLGFYVSSHPLDSVRDTLPLMTTHSVLELPRLADGTTVRIGGLLSKVEHRMSRKNKPLIIGKVEDFTGEQEFVVFGRTVEEVRPTLIEGEKVILKAKVSYRGDDGEQFSLIINEALPVERCQPFEIEFKSPPTYEETAFIAKVLRENHGDLPTIFRFPGGVRLKAGANFWVNPNAISTVQAQFRRVLG